MYSKSDFNAFLSYLGLGESAVNFLNDSFCSLQEKDIISLFDSKIKQLEKDEFPTRDYYLALESICLSVATTDVSEHTASFIFICMCAPYAYNQLEKQGYSQNVIKDTFDDYRVKLDECYSLYGVYGTFVAPWFIGFIQGKRVKLGRLQFAREKTKFDYNKFNLDIKKGDEIIAIHIPSGEKLTIDSIYNSLKLAYKNFDGKGSMAFTCHTSFLFTDYLEIFKQGSNIRKFIDLFDVVDNSYTESFDNCWRFFNCNYNGNPDDLPNTNSLQKAFIEHLKKGGAHGVGFGYLVYDGEKVLTQK